MGQYSAFGEQDVIDDLHDFFIRWLHRTNDNEFILERKAESIQMKYTAMHPFLSSKTYRLITKLSGFYIKNDGNPYQMKDGEIIEALEYLSDRHKELSK